MMDVNELTLYGISKEMIAMEELWEMAIDEEAGEIKDAALESVNLKWKLAQESVKRYLEWFKKYFISKKNSTKKHRCLCSKKYSF